MHVIVDGKRYKLRFADLRHTENKGDVDPPNAVDKEIRLDRSLRGEELLEILIHECLHIYDWKKDESYVDKEAKELARIIWRMGYRRTESEKKSKR